MAKAEASRQVLATAEAAVNWLREDVPMGPRWLILWTASVALLRSVGHTLWKVDAEGDPALRSAASAAYEEWNSPDAAEHAIFRFIEDARNLTLKEGTPGKRIDGLDAPGSAGQGVTVRPGGGHEVHYQVYDDRFADRDQLEVLDAAVAWWHRQLDDIEAAADSD
jgi:hypothetical protein